MPMGRSFPSTTPDLGTIESSLRHCSLATHLCPDISIHLNSEVPLPLLWEQVLNIQTGEIYYINREDGTKTSLDPRLSILEESASESTVDNDASYDGGSSSISSSYYSDNCQEVSSNSSAISVATSYSSSSSASSSRPQQKGSGDVLVLVGCRTCLTLSMVPRTEDECPKCRDSALVHF